MISIFKFITLVCFIPTLLLYSEISKPIPNETFRFNQQLFEFSKNSTFECKINVEGEYCINIIPINQASYKNDLIIARLEPDGVFNFSSVLRFEKSKEFASTIFHSESDINYKISFEKIPDRLMNKPFILSITESTGTASKNLYLMSDLRPTWFVLFKISFLCFVTSGTILILLIIKNKRKIN